MKSGDFPENRPDASNDIKKRSWKIVAMTLIHLQYNKKALTRPSDEDDGENR